MKYTVGILGSGAMNQEVNSFVSLVNLCETRSA